MNNRKRARIKELKRQCRPAMRKHSGYGAVRAMVWMRYQEEIGRIALGDDLADRFFNEFINRKMILPWKKNVRTTWIKQPAYRRRDIEFKTVVPDGSDA